MKQKSRYKKRRKRTIKRYTPPIQFDWPEQMKKDYEEEQKDRMMKGHRHSKKDKSLSIPDLNHYAGLKRRKII